MENHLIRATRPALARVWKGNALGRIDRAAAIQIYAHDRVTDVVAIKNTNIDYITELSIEGGKHLAGKAAQAVREHPNPWTVEMVGRAISRRERLIDRTMRDLED